MRILYHFRTRGTGAEAVHVAGMARAFERLGHEVVFSSPTGVDPRQTAGSNPFQLPAKENLLHRLASCSPRWLFELLELGYNVPAWRRNARLLRQGRFGLLYERHAFFLFSTAWLAKRRGIPLVLEVNELVGDARVREQPLLSGIVRWCDRFAFRRADLIVVVSPHLKRRIEALGVDGSKVLVLPNAVDEDDYQSPASGAEVRRRWGLEATVNIGFVGWFVPWHQLEMLVRVFAGLCARQPGLRLVLMGEGDLRASLAAQAGAAGVGDKVVFTGAVTHREMPAHLAAMDICVVPHSNEYRSPIKLFEYMGQGRCVVAPRTEPIEMVVRHGENGLLFEPGSTDALTATLADALADAQLRERLSTQARADVLTRHTWTENARAVLGALPGI
jgi:glycosyltransferase involved in cell wall biosynthesis